MFSIIICSISPERLSQLKANIQKTIGVEHEIIAFDNREKRYPIARVYNEGARQARYPYLFFVHEDVLFHSENWGEVIAGKLKEPDCGVIGFVGSKMKLKVYSGWMQSGEDRCGFLYQRVGKNAEFCAFNVLLEHPFEEVITVDGLGMFVRKQLWEKYPFDEKMLTGFHCYDLDFSLQIAATKQYKNYICTSPKVLIEHFSLGNFDCQWVENTIRMHKQKWNAFLPLKVPGYKISKSQEKKLTERCFSNFMRHMLKSDYPHKLTVMKEFMLCPFSWKHFGHCWAHLFRYIKYNHRTQQKQ